MGAIVGIVLFVLLAVAFYEYKSAAGEAGPLPSDGLGNGTVEFGDGATERGNAVIDPGNESTWPEGDQFWDIARAIAKAEGYGPPENTPTKLHNPGDLSDGASKFGHQFHSGSNVTTFPDHETGWNWLHDKLANIYAGKSEVYGQNSTWTQIAQKWAGDWQNWLRNVTRELNVNADDTLTNFVEQWNA